MVYELARITGHWGRQNWDVGAYSYGVELVEPVADSLGHNSPQPRHRDAIPETTLIVWPSCSWVLRVFLK